MQVLGAFQTYKNYLEHQQSYETPPDAQLLSHAPPDNEAPLQSLGPQQAGTAAESAPPSAAPPFPGQSSSPSVPSMSATDPAKEPAEGRSETASLAEADQAAQPSLEESGDVGASGQADRAKEVEESRVLGPGVRHLADSPSTSDAGEEADQKPPQVRCLP